MSLKPDANNSNNFEEAFNFKESTWVCDCINRVEIKLDGNTKALTNYQVKVTVPKYPNINTNFSNIQFTASDQSTPINHFVQSNNGTTASVWVKVPTIPVGGTSIYMYFNNCGNAGSPENVFDYYNDFTSSAGINTYSSGGFDIGTFAGRSVLTKNGRCDPHGAEIPLGFTLDDYVLITEEVRPDGAASDSGCPWNRYGMENSSRNGYGIRRNGHTGNSFGVERRRNAGGGNYSGATVSPPTSRNTFVTSELRRCTSDNRNEAELFDGNGNSVAASVSSLSSHDYSNFDRIAIRGGRDYHIDYMAVAKYSCNPPKATFGQPITDEPEALCQNVTVNLDASGNATISRTDIDNASNDNCDASLNYSLSETMFNCADSGTKNVTLTVTNDHGGTDQCVSLVTIRDNLPPSITCPASRNITTDPGRCDASNVNLGSLVNSDNCAISSIGNNGLTIYPIGNTIVTWTARDSSGNVSTCNQTITIQDTLPPDIICPAAISVAAISPGCNNTGIDLTALQSTDNCGTMSVTNNKPDTFFLGMTVVTWIATDIYGNSSTCEQEITVTDNDPPNVTCAPDVEVFADNSCDVQVVFLSAPVGADNCRISRLTHNAPTSFPIGTTAVTWTITDSGLNTNTCTQNVIVADSTKPIIICADTIFVNTAVSMCSAAATLTNPTATDNCGLNPLNNNAPANFPLGITTVVWTVEDVSGNSATCNQIVKVADNEKPSITCPNDTTIFTTPLLCELSSVILNNPVTSDNCSIASITNNAPNNYSIGTRQVEWVVKDGSGNNNNCTHQITIQDTIKPLISCLDTVSATSSLGMCAGTDADLGTPLVSDACGIQSLTNNKPATFPVGMTSVIWAVADKNGNTQTCHTVVALKDIEPPTITCPDTLRIPYNDISCSIPKADINLGTPITADNCGVVSLTNDAPNIFHEGMTLVTWTVMDAAGNAAECEQYVIICERAVPTTSEWGLIILLLLLSIVGVLALIQRKELS